MRLDDFLCYVRPIFGRCDDGDSSIVVQLVLQTALLFVEVGKGRLEDKEGYLSNDSSELVIELLNLVDA